MSTATTSFGEVPVEILVKRYELEKQRNAKRAEKRLAYLQTDAGKEWNRARSKSYYERNREAVLAKRKATYVPKRAPRVPESSGTPVAEA